MHGTAAEVLHDGVRERISRNKPLVTQCDIVRVVQA
jgi:hypothetical protein